MARFQSIGWQCREMWCFMSSFKTVMTNELELLLKGPNPINLIDVREPYEYRSGHIPGAINMPLSDFHIDKLDKNQEYYLICFSGSRSIEAARALANYGYKVINILGGTSLYRGVLKR